jgi:hypothetical protein
MGLFSFLFKKKSASVAEQLPAEVPPTAPTGRADHAPQPIPDSATAPIAPYPSRGSTEPITPVEQPAMPTRSPEEMCEIDPTTMDRDAIHAHLAALYRRHNAAAASLDTELRAEAELMLDAIVACREKYVEVA